jgi:hypothetical protein
VAARRSATRSPATSACRSSHASPRLLVRAGYLAADGQALAVRQQVTTNLQDVRRLRLDLEPWRDTQAVRELDEQLAAVGGAT